MNKQKAKTNKGRTTNDPRSIEKKDPRNQKNESRNDRKWFKNEAKRSKIDQKKTAKRSKMDQKWSQEEQTLEADRTRWPKTAPKSRPGGPTWAIPYSRRPKMEAKIIQNRLKNR